jgi:ArsR family transcriptional regulator, cadmium/lead-responsive transcriptional repressor
VTDARAATPCLLPERRAEVELVAKYFRVLGDPTRLRILELLADRGELAVGALVERLGESQPKVSNHLACLRQCGFVHTRRQHPLIYYRLADDGVARLLELGRALLAGSAVHVAACRRVDGAAAFSPTPTHQAVR